MFSLVPVMKAKVVEYFSLRQPHRTLNTLSLDEHFDLQAHYKVGILPSVQWEVQARLYCDLARRMGHFVAVPRHSPSFLEFEVGDCIDAMMEEGLLQKEVVAGSVEVVSPTEDLARRIYQRSRTREGEVLR